MGKGKKTSSWKILLLLAIRQQEKGVLDAQIALGLPGLAKECTIICHTIVTRYV